jgi:hypothetical protein
MTHSSFVALIGAMDVMGKREEMHSENGFPIYRKFVHCYKVTHQ